MKNLFILFAFVGISKVAKSQGNLQFNQAKLVTTVETVPAGKVWKVENATYNGGAIFCLSTGPSTVNCGSSLGGIGVYGYMSFNINGQATYIYGTNANGYGGYSAPLPFPFWLPAGATLAAGTNVRYLSVIEFNVVP